MGDRRLTPSRSPRWCGPRSRSAEPARRLACLRRRLGDLLGRLAARGAARPQPTLPSTAPRPAGIAGDHFGGHLALVSRSSPSAPTRHGMASTAPRSASPSRSPLIGASSPTGLAGSRLPRQLPVGGFATIGVTYWKLRRSRDPRPAYRLGWRRHLPPRCCDWCSRSCGQRRGLASPLIVSLSAPPRAALMPPIMRSRAASTILFSPSASPPRRLHGYQIASFAGSASIFPVFLLSPLYLQTSCCYSAIDPARYLPITAAPSSSPRSRGLRWRSPRAT